MWMNVRRRSRVAAYADYAGLQTKVVGAMNFFGSKEHAGSSDARSRGAAAT